MLLLLLLLSCFSHVQLCAALWTEACQAPLSMEFSRLEFPLQFYSGNELSTLILWKVGHEGKSIGLVSF